MNSFDYCRRAVRSAKSNFSLAFHLLPPDARRGMDALYAFMRATDDLSDVAGLCEAGSHKIGVTDPSYKTSQDTGTTLEKRAAITAWRHGTESALAGVYSHPIHAALHHTVRTFQIPPRYLFDVIDGVEADLDIVRFATFDELRPYCYRVASAVGLACLPIWGCHNPAAAVPGEAVGIAFQLMNILRDLGEDRARGRVYLPQDDLARFGCPAETWSHTDPAFRAMMQFQVSRAEQFYREGEALNEYLSPSGRAIFSVMNRTYRALLATIVRKKFDVFTDRVRVAKWRKMSAFVAAWPIKWGWS